jgi:Zn-dependent peptidase ImmA (M78 family)
LVISQGLGVHPSPTECARDLLSKLDITSVPIYPRKIAEEIGIFVQEMKVEGGYDGYLMCANGVWGIMINGSIKSRARKRFTIAHELGHYYISRHDEGNHQCFRKDIGAVDPSARQDEREANEFAVELLMPNDFFRSDMHGRSINLDTINWLATRYGTSMTSTAIRYAHFSTDICAVILSERGRIKYFVCSEGFRKGRFLQLSRNAPLRNGCYAKELFDTRFQAPERYGEVEASSWSTNCAHPEMAVLEHSRCLPAFDQTLSLLWFEEKREDPSQQIAHVLVE